LSNLPTVLGFRHDAQAGDGLIFRKTIGRFAAVRMGAGQKRADLRANAQAKFDDALALFKNGRFSNSYYLAGYSVEIGLKACIAAQISNETIPDKALLKGVLSHEVQELVGLAGLRKELEDRENADPVFAANWGIVCEWTSDVRYEEVDATTAHHMIEAVGNPGSGVLGWIKKHW
jgi:HEPN domain-containing protein